MGSHRVGHDWSDLAAAAAASIYVTLPSKQPLKVSIVALGQKIEATGDKEFWSNPTALDNIP